MITIIHNKNYVLIKKRKKIQPLNYIINQNKVILSYNLINKILRTNWTKLWTNKIDYIEYQILHIESKYKLLRNSIWYYIGLAENSVQYIKDNDLTKNTSTEYVISHRRINDFNELSNPLNIIVDHKSRDVSEYLKYLFIKKEYDYEEIKKILQKKSLDEITCKMIYARMFFVTFYFDLYDDILNKRIEENKIENIIKRNSEYEDYIKNIYIIINEIKKIPEISWI